MTSYQSRHTLKKYAAAGALALGLTLTANSSASAGDVQAAEVLSPAPWDAQKEAATNTHIPRCVAQTITFGSGSAWSLCVKTVTKHGLVISHASFRKSPTSGFITVLFDGRWSSIFVAYHRGSPRFHDISAFNFSARPLGAGDCPSSFFNPRVLLDGNTICREFRDTEIEWKEGFGGSRVRRGVEVVYTAVLGAANYAYLQEWAFRDDGTITPRAGSTGPQFGGSEGVGHTHNITWRLDFDLNGAGGDSACISRHFEIGATGTDRCDLIGTEAGLDWNAFQFNTLKITDATLRNGRGRKTEYELVPLRSGTYRNSLGRADEAFLQHDFWVTRFRNGESLFAEALPQLANGEPTVGQDLVEWYTQTVHHEANERDEKTPTTPTIWTGFELVPQNLFDRTPFF